MSPSPPRVSLVILCDNDRHDAGTAVRNVQDQQTSFAVEIFVGGLRTNGSR
jgi:hypothetical protein